jgi:single-strand DNA-binding protein
MKMAKGTINKVTLIGRLGAKPEVKYMPSGNAVTQLNLATNESYKDRQSGQAVESTEWHKVTFFGKPAEVIGEYCDKGSMLYVEGRLTTRKWQDKNTGQDRYSTEITGREFQFIGGGGNQNQGQGQAPQYGSTEKPMNAGNITSAKTPTQATPSNPNQPTNTPKAPESLKPQAPTPQQDIQPNIAQFDNDFEDLPF